MNRTLCYCCGFDVEKLCDALTYAVHVEPCLGEDPLFREKVENADLRLVQGVVGYVVEVDPDAFPEVPA